LSGWGRIVDVLGKDIFCLWRKLDDDEEMISIGMLRRLLLI
jgi:hypothetical protein